MNAGTPLQRIERHCIPVTESGCWLWTGSTIAGSGYASMGYHGKVVPAHRVAWIEHFGPIPDGLHVCHRCDVRCCVNPAHLFLGTRRDNMQDMIRKGRRVLIEGEKHGCSKLNEDQVRAIRDDRRCSRLIAEDYGVSGIQVRRIKNGRAWTHLLERKAPDETQA